jgi:hypothetical protein
MKLQYSWFLQIDFMLVIQSFRKLLENTSQWTLQNQPHHPLIKALEMKVKEVGDVKKVEVIEVGDECGRGIERRRKR